jgi:molybdate/tungstate transport system ATP-binding protein
MIQIQDLCIHFSNFALKNVHINIKKHEFFIILGPTGSGKTVLVESIAGIIPVNSGNILINGHDMTHAPPEKRKVGIVYQDYALFPHMTVLENIQYGLSYHKKSHDDRQRIHDLMAKTGLLHLSHRKPKYLSGGEKQRIALVRALAVRPSVLLLDEPLSALDPCFRDDIQKLLKMLHEQTGTTFLMVTHNFAEALFLGDQGAVLNNGIVEQCGSVESLYTSPQTLFVARFMGFKNIFDVQIDKSKAKTNFFELETSPSIVQEATYICFRGEDIQIHPKCPEPMPVNTFLGKIQNIVDRGPYCELAVHANNALIYAILTKGELLKNAYHTEKNVFISIPPLAVHYFN